MSNPDWLISGGEVLARELAMSDAHRGPGYVQGPPADWFVPDDLREKPKPDRFDFNLRKRGPIGTVRALDKARKSMKNTPSPAIPRARVPLTEQMHRSKE